jgi:TRAP-type mannitol/chloroaromatic compound transport system permease small subunit
MAYEVLMRHAFDEPQIWATEVPIMFGATIYAMGWAYVHRHNGHIRIDVLYTRLSPRGKAIIDVLGYLLLFAPLIALLFYVSVLLARRAWLLNEVMVESYWYPPAAPLRTAVMVGFFLFTLQGLAQFIRDLYLIIRNKPYD